MEKKLYVKEISLIVYKKKYTNVYTYTRIYIYYRKWLKDYNIIVGIYIQDGLKIVFHGNAKVPLLEETMSMFHTILEGN